MAAENVETFHFKPPYTMIAHGSDKNGLSWSDGQIVCEKLSETINEAVSGYAHLYAYVLAKTRFLTELLAQPVRNREDFKCPPAPRPQGSVQLQYALPQELSKLQLRNT